MTTKNVHVKVDEMKTAHASWSFPNASVKDWANNLKAMISKFEEVPIAKALNKSKG